MFDPLSDNIEPYGSRDMTITYIPTGNGQNTGQINLVTNDANNPSFTIDLVGEGLVPPVTTVSTGLLEAYVSQNDSTIKTFQISNEGESDLYWSVDLGHDQNIRQNGTDFRNNWADQMIDRQESSSTIKSEIEAHLNDKKTTIIKNLKGINNHPENKTEKRLKNFASENNVKVKIQDINEINNFEIEYQINTILPPEAHRSRDGHTSISILMDNQYYAWNTLDALSWYYDNYTINEVYTNWDTYNLEQSIMDTDILLIPMGHWVSNYDYYSFRNVIENYTSNGGNVIFTGSNNNGYGVYDDAYGYYSFCCSEMAFDNMNYDENHPIMNGVGSEYDIVEAYTNYIFMILVHIQTLRVFSTLIQNMAMVMITVT